MVTLLSASTRALTRALARMALPVDELLALAELPRDAVDDVDARLPAARVDALWAAPRALRHRPDDGAEIGFRVPVAVGLLCLLVATLRRRRDAA